MEYKGIETFDVPNINRQVTTEPVAMSQLPEPEYHILALTEKI